MKEDETVNEREEIDVTLLGYVPVFSIEEILKEFGKFTGDVSRKIPLAKFKNQIAFIENVIGYLKENDNKYSTKDLIVQKWWNNRFCNSLGSLAEDFIPYTTLFEMVERTAKLETLTTLDVIKNELVTEPEYEKRKKVQHARYQEQFKEVLEDSQEGVFDPLLDTSRRNINASLNDLAIHKNIPFICGDDLHKLTCCLWVECYRKKIELKAHVGYDKLKNNLENSRSLYVFMKNGGRNAKQKLLDRTTKKIDEDVIETLESIAKWDISVDVRGYAKMMVDNYQLGGAFDLGKKLESGKY